MFHQMYEEKYMRFYGGKCKAVTFSYDDGVKADKRLVEIFDRHGLKATFNLNSKLFDCERWHDRMDEQQTYITFYNRPHEIAMHGARHVSLDKVPLAEGINELVSNKTYLENRFGRIVEGLAYAYGAYTEDILRVLPSLGVKYARTAKSAYGFSLPDNFLLWDPTCHHTDERLFAYAEKFIAADPAGELKHREPLLFFVWGHAYEFDDNGDWDRMETLAAQLGGRQDVWYATCGEICAYKTAYDNLRFSSDGERVYNPSCLSVWIELRGRTYEIKPGNTVQFDKEI